MIHTFPELIIGGVLFTPFLTYLGSALVVILILQPLLLLVGFAKLFSSAAIAQLSLYVTVLGLLMLLS